MIKPLYLTRYATATPTATEIIEGTDYPQRIHYCPDTYAGIKTGLKYPPHQLAEKVLKKEILEYLGATKKKTAFILSAGSTSFAGLRNTKSSWMAFDYRFPVLTYLPVYAGKVSQRCYADDMVQVDSSACASSTKVLMDAQTLTSLHGFERVVILAVDDQVNEYAQRFFGELKATITQSQELEGAKPSAFDDVNFGFNLGQGAAFAVLETEPCASDDPVLLGAYTSGERSESAVGQREDGEGFVRAAGAALSIAGRPSVDVIKTHGTGTLSNNLAEKTAITKLFGETGYVATSFKPTLGHTLGASGLLETCLLIDSMRQQCKVPEIANRTREDDVFLSAPVARSEGIILSLAAGMGNIYSAAVWRI